jgi:hypothetical protein
LSIYFLFEFIDTEFSGCRFRKGLSHLRRGRTQAPLLSKGEKKILTYGVIFLAPLYNLERNLCTKITLGNKEHNKLLAKSYTYFPLMFTDLDGRIMIQKQEE